MSLRHRLLAPLTLLLALCAISCGRSEKKSFQKQVATGQELQASYEFRSPGNTYTHTLETIIRADARPQGLLRLVPFFGPSGAPAPEEGYRAASKVQPPTSPDGRRLLVSYDRQIYCLDLESGVPLWRLKVGKGRPTIFPHNGRYVVKLEDVWKTFTTIDPEKAVLIEEAPVSPHQLASPDELDQDYVRLTVTETGAHRYEFLPDGPILHGRSTAKAPRLNYPALGAFDPETDETLWVVQFQYGVKAFNRAGDRYFFQTMDAKGNGWVYVLRITPRDSP